MSQPTGTQPQPSELMAQTWLQSLPELHHIDIQIDWEAVKSWDGQRPLITIDDVFANLDGSFVIPNCVQIDVWSPDQAEELAQAIWQAADTTNIDRLRAPQFLPDQGGRWSLDLVFRTPTQLASGYQPAHRVHPRPARRAGPPSQHPLTSPAHRRTDDTA